MTASLPSGEQPEVAGVRVAVQATDPWRARQQEAAQQQPGPVAFGDGAAAGDLRHGRPSTHSETSTRSATSTT